MIELHPEILEKDGKPQFAILPYDEFVQLRNTAMNGGSSLPAVDPRFGAFHENLTLEEMLRRQGVKPAASRAELYGDGDPADWVGFDEALEVARAANPLS